MTDYTTSCVPRMLLLTDLLIDWLIGWVVGSLAS